MMSDTEVQYGKQIEEGMPLANWGWGRDSSHHLLIPQPSGRHEDLKILKSEVRKVKQFIQYHTTNWWQSQNHSPLSRDVSRPVTGAEWDLALILCKAVTCEYGGKTELLKSLSG